MTLQPIIPFEPVSSDQIPNGTDWISQIKWDGVRVLSYLDGKETRLYNRQLNERTRIFPEIADAAAYTDASSAILDGEVIALDETGTPSFHKVMRRDGIRRLDRVPPMMESVPIYYMVFDVVYYNGKWVNVLPLYERLQLLDRILLPNAHVQLVPRQQDGNQLFNVVKERNMEGIVCKKLSSTYILDGKNDNWRKIKNYKDIIAVVGGVTYRSGIVNSLLLGLYDQGELLFIGSAGTGKLTAADWRHLTESLGPFKIEAAPFKAIPKSIKNIQWLKPVITVKVQFIDWPEGHSIRQPSIQAFVQQKPETCLFPQ
ncbi:ATP-dependent DNA ligase [Bacillus testis]|uniref:ATP-dependent DNA ligase n=1 Tax=Bacillus testis TaxID=1622072 RepID=UPI00067EF71D|nr:RNA ligase family protein [Bacillus testis]